MSPAPVEMVHGAVAQRRLAKLVFLLAKILQLRYKEEAGYVEEANLTQGNNIQIPYPIVNRRR